jgi:hypothetical protein
MELFLPAFCPQCRTRCALFDLLPDSTRTLSSIRCPTCRRTNAAALANLVAAVQGPPPKPAKRTCLKCRDLIFANWRYCILCGEPCPLN